MDNKRAIENGKLVEVNKSNTLFSSENLKEVRLQLVDRTIVTCDREFKIIKLKGTLLLECLCQDTPYSSPLTLLSNQDIYIDYVIGDIISNCYVPYSMRYISTQVFTCIEKFFKEIFNTLLKMDGDKSPTDIYAARYVTTERK